MVNNVKKYSDSNKKSEEEARKLLHEYYKRDGEYLGTAGMVATLMFNKKPTMGELGQNAWLYAYEDGDQGNFNSVSLYLHESGNNAKANSIAKNVMNNNDKIKKASKEYVDKLLGEYGDTTMSKNSKWTVNEEAVWDLKDKLENRSSLNTYSLIEGTGTDWSKASKELNTAKSIVNKLDKRVVNDDEGWEAFNVVVTKLGYDKTAYSDMTKSDWNKINEALNDYIPDYSLYR